MEAVCAATAGARPPADSSDHSGPSRAGRPADLLVVDGDPLADPELLLDDERIWLVIQAGRPVAGTALEASLPGLDRPDAGPSADPVPALAGRPMSPPGGSQAEQAQPAT